MNHLSRSLSLSLLYCHLQQKVRRKSGPFLRECVAIQTGTTLSFILALPTPYVTFAAPLFLDFF